MINNIEIIFGVCVDNADPNNAHRIRFIELSKLDTINRSYSDILSIVYNDDDNGNYQPWGYPTQTLQQDPYLAEPFMGKYINMVPDKGQLIKVFKYSLNKITYEYIGPVTSDLINTKEGFISSLQKTKPNNNLENGVTPGVDILPISGKNNEQILLGDNTIINRVGYLSPNNKKNDKFSFTQLVEFPISITKTSNEITKTTDIDYPIDFVISVNFIYNKESNINLKLNIYDSNKIINNKGLFGLRKSDVSFTDKFRSYLKSPVISYDITSGDIKKIFNEFLNIITNFKQKKIYKFPPNHTDEVFTYTETDLTIIINNLYGFLPNSGNALPENPALIFNDNFVVIKDLNQINYGILSQSTLNSQYNISDPTKLYNFSTLSSFITQGAYENFITKLSVTTKTETLTQDIITSEDKTDTYLINHVNKILLYSTNNDNSLTTIDNSSNGATQQKILDVFNKSHPILRGDKLLNVLISLINLLITHGHQAGVNPPESLDETSKKTLNDLIQTLQKDLIDDVNSVTMNHNIRIN